MAPKGMYHLLLFEVPSSSEKPKKNTDLLEDIFHSNNSRNSVMDQGTLPPLLFKIFSCL